MARVVSRILKPKEGPSKGIALGRSNDFSVISLAPNNNLQTPCTSIKWVGIASHTILLAVHQEWALAGVAQLAHLLVGHLGLVRIGRRGDCLARPRHHGVLDVVRVRVDLVGRALEVLVDGVVSAGGV